jgi:hypothetical protein
MAAPDGRWTSPTRTAALDGRWTHPTRTAALDGRKTSQSKKVAADGQTTHPLKKSVWMAQNDAEVECIRRGECMNPLNRGKWGDCH